MRIIKNTFSLLFASGLFIGAFSATLANARNDKENKGEKQMSELTAGSPAPGFSLPSQDGKTYNLKDYKGKWVVLYFYPKDDTPGCTKEACSFRDSNDKYAKLGIQVFGVSVDDVKSHGEFAKKFNLNFPLLADTDKKVSTAYNAFSNGRNADRFTYLIKPDQTIGHVFKKVNVEAHADEVLSEIEKLNHK
jgi:peroxiredoxin Q/BCP